VKVVFVAGFFTPVLDKLREKFADQIKSRNLIWIRQFGPDGGVNEKEFRENFNDRLAVGAQDVLVLIAALNGKEHTLYRIDGAIAAAKRRWRDATIVVEHVKDAGAFDLVVSRVEAIFPSAPVIESTISAKHLREKITGRILCVRERNHTSFQRAFQRAGVLRETWVEFFDEEVVDHGKVNLVSWMKQKSKTYSRIIYSWHGLKYIGGTDLECPIHQAGDARDAIDRFRQWLFDGDTEGD
jgi:hypothetical protein